MDNEKFELMRSLASDIEKNEQDIQEQELIKDKNWIDAFKVMYAYDNDGEPFNGTDEEAAREGLKFMSDLTYSFTLDTVPFAAKVASTGLDDLQKISLRYLMQTYDNKDISIDGFKRFAKSMGLDPLTYVGITTLGWGFAAKQSAKEVAKRSLWEATKLNVKEWIKSPMGAAAFEGAIYSSADDAAFQAIKMETGEQEEFSVGQNVVAGTAGAVLAPVAGAAMVKTGEVAKKGIKRARDKFGRFVKDTENDMAKLAGGGEPDFDPVLKTKENQRKEYKKVSEQESVKREPNIDQYKETPKINDETYNSKGVKNGIISKTKGDSK